MSTTTRKKPIDLSKCKVGQRVKLRNGQITKITENTHSLVFPWRSAAKEAYTKEGWYFAHGEKHRLDIIALLPLPKKAGKAGKPGKKKADNYILDNLRRLIADFEASRDVFTKEINRLKGLLKP